MTPPPQQQLRTGSLRVRVTAVAVVVVTVVLIAVIAISASLFGAASHRTVSSLLTDRATTARQLARTTTSPQAFVERIDGRSVRAQLVLADGTMVGRLPAEQDIAARRVVALSGPHEWSQGAHVTLVVENRLLTGVRSRLLWGMVITGLCAVALTAVLLWLGMRYALAPLDTMTSLARSITRGTRGGRLSPQRRDTELGRTAAAFDDMLDSLEGAEANERAAQQSVRRFVADAAHELRTPITGVTAIAETLLQTDQDAPLEDREQLLLLLVRETRRAGRLVDDMVDMARIDAGLALHIVDTDVVALAAEQAARVRLLHPDLVITTDGTAPMVPADPGRISQILANLLDNACQATSSGGSVSVTASTTPGWVHVTVADTGPGIAPDDRERVFGRMVRLDEARDQRSGGSGLGLAVARGLARTHGGEVRLLDSPPPGARFVVDLPMRGRF